MNLCLINSMPGWGGGERMFLELAEGFAAAGHKVVSVCRPGSVLAARLPPHQSTVLLACRSDYDIASLLALRRLFEQHAIDAVLVNAGRDCMLAGLAAWRRGVPVVRVKAMESTHRNLRNRLLYRHLLAGVVSVSQAVQEGLRDLHLPAHKLAVIHNGVEVQLPALSRAQARRELEIPEAAFVVAYAGRFESEKGVDLLPEVIANLVERHVPVLLLAAGDGALLPSVQAQCTRRELARHIRFLGFVDEPLRMLRAADAVVMPSRTEAFPVAALEALWAGVPLVASAAGGLREIITSEIDGLLLPVGDAAALADGLARLYENPELGQHLVQNGYAKAARFSRSSMIDRYVAFLHTLRIDDSDRLAT